MAADAGCSDPDASGSLGRWPRRTRAGFRVHGRPGASLRASGVADVRTRPPRHASRSQRRRSTDHERPTPCCWRRTRRCAGWRSCRDRTGRRRGAPRNCHLVWLVPPPEARGAGNRVARYGMAYSRGNPGLPRFSTNSSHADGACPSDTPAVSRQIRPGTFPSHRTTKRSHAPTSSTTARQFYGPRGNRTRHAARTGASTAARWATRQRTCESCTLLIWSAPHRASVNSATWVSTRRRCGPIPTRRGRPRHLRTDWSSRHGSQAECHTGGMGRASRPPASRSRATGQRLRRTPPHPQGLRSCPRGSRARRRRDPP